MFCFSTGIMSPSALSRQFVENGKIKRDNTAAFCVVGLVRHARRCASKWGYGRLAASCLFG